MRFFVKGGGYNPRGTNCKLLMASLQLKPRGDLYDAIFLQISPFQILQVLIFLSILLVA